MKTNLRKIDFTNKKIFVGVDVHEKKWFSTIIVGEVATRYNCNAKPEQLAKFIKENYPNGNISIAYEAGCFGFWAKEELDKLGCPTVVINPADIPTSHKDKDIKNDDRDSRKIAIALKSGMLTPIYCPDKETQEDRSMLRYREDLTSKTTRVKNQIKSLLKFFGIEYIEEFKFGKSHWSKRFINWLSQIKFATTSGNFVMAGHLRELEFLMQEKKMVQKEISKIMKKDKYAKSYDIAKSVPGIGAVGAASIVLEVIDINRFSQDDQFVSFVGLSPTEHSSGERQKVGHMTRRCNRVLRKIFIEAAWVAVRTDPALTMYFNNQIKVMKKTKAIIKVARKLVKRVMHLLKKGEEYAKGVVG